MALEREVYDRTQKKVHFTGVLMALNSGKLGEIRG